MGTFLKRLFVEWNKYQEEIAVKPAPAPPVPVPEPPKPPELIPIPPVPEPPPKPEPAPIPTHGPETINLLEKDISDTTLWDKVKVICQGGPTHLIIADTNLIPEQMHKNGFQGRDNALWFSLSRTIAGFAWTPGEDGELQILSNQKDAMSKWWENYIGKVVEVMEATHQTTAVIITNDALDHCGRQLGNATYKMMGPVVDRVSIGDTVPD